MPGRDVVSADARDRVETDCEVVSRRIHRDRHANAESQHESEVEPDSQTVGQTTVAVFQVGRNRTGGAASIGFSTSKDGGRTWREGTLPGLTANTTPRGPSARASDPVVAYDAAHGVWLANTLAIAADATRLTIHRSTDGLSWSAPIDAALVAEREARLRQELAARATTAHKPVSRPLLPRVHADRRAMRTILAVQCSNDGGRNWSPPVTLRISVTGVIPVVQPDGKLVLAFWSGRTGMVAVTSTDGGAQPGEPGDDLRPPRAGREASTRAEPDRRRGRRRRTRSSSSGRTAASASAAPPTTWSSRDRPTGRPGRRRRGSPRAGTLSSPPSGVEPGSGRLAIAYYVIQPNGIDAELVTSADGVRWSEPQRLNPRRMPLAWLPETTLGRMLADYIGVSWSRGKPLVVYALASPPKQDESRQAIYAARG